ncbi:putative nuclease HARBI1 [Trichomycterus rosablanca]|uniref:putative nuclease HARBI1 n=1 Tax=Trichomycterus rosablanca TaxID=2290929 RepID=UPI002F35EA4C
MYPDFTARRHRALRRRRTVRKVLFLYFSKNHGNPARYCNLNRSVPILQLYFSGADLSTELRLSRETITSLTAALGDESDRGWSRDIEVLVFLYWLAHAASYRVVSQAFAFPKSSVHNIVHRMSGAVKELIRSIITLPTGDELERVGAGFAHLAGSSCFRGAVGAIDRCHIRIKPPSTNAQSYLNRKQFHSIQLQAICDHQGKFIDIFVGYPGSVHEARVLENSPLYKEGLYPPAGRYILGDGSYPCISTPIRLLTPYREPVQNPVQALFNSKLSQSRIVVKRAFGMLKTRWRSIFFKTLEVRPVFAPEVVACCAVLHNFCIAQGDITEPEISEEDVDLPEPVSNEIRSGEDARENLAAAVSAPQHSIPAHEHDYI